MESKSMERRYEIALIGLAVFVLLDTLLLAPVLVVAFTLPDWLWLALGPYLGLTGGALVVGGYFLHRWGLLTLRGPWMPGLSRFLAALTILTAGFIAAVVLRPEWIWPALLLYLLAVGYAIYWLVKWQAANLAFQCSGCGESFRGSVRTWIGSLSLGSRKYVTCPFCKKGTWASIVAARAVTNPTPAERGGGTS